MELPSALDDLQIRAPTNGFAAEEHAGLVYCTTPMHQIPASVNAFCAWLVALHFWPIFDPSSLKTAEIRHFPSASAAKTVELESRRTSMRTRSRARCAAASTCTAP